MYIYRLVIKIKKNENEKFQSGVTGNDSPQAIFTSFKLPKPCSGTFTNNLQQSDNETSSPPNNRMESPKHVSQQTLVSLMRRRIFIMRESQKSGI